MSIPQLRQLVTTAGGTPTRYSDVGLWREIVTALGGTPEGYSVNKLVREVIVLAGGVPTKFTYTLLLRELVETLGGVPESFSRHALLDQIIDLGLGAAEPWTPASIPSLKAWFVADDLTTADGAQADSWTDRVNGLVATKLTFGFSVHHNVLNGKKVVRNLSSAFSGYTLGTALLNGATQGTLIGVGKNALATQPADTCGPFAGGFTSSSSRAMHKAYYDAWVETFGCAAQYSTGAIGSLTAFHMASVHTAASSRRVYINGVSKHNSTAAHTVAFGDGLEKRLLNDRYGVPYGGDVAEVLIFDADLSDEDRQKVEGYHAHFYGITSVLAADHPYKSSPPGSAGPAAPVNNALPAITGTLGTGNTLTASTGSWTGASSYAYQWMKDGVDISGATSSTYLLASGDAGSNITVEVTATGPGGSTAATSAAVGPIIGAPANTVAPAITGTAKEGETLTLSDGTWTGSPTLSRQWLLNGSAISGATGSTYVCQDADIGGMISAQVTGSTIGGAASASAAEVGPVATGAPVNTVLPALTGTATEGETITTSNGDWTNDVNGYAYVWQRDDVDISGATGSSYTLTAADVGAQINSGVVAFGDYGATMAKSAKTAAVASAVPVNTAAPSVTGLAQEGETLTCSTGTFSGTGLSYTYQWYRGASTAIPGATAATYVPVTADVGSQLRCDVTATNSYGSDTAASNYTGSVVALGGLSSTNATLVSGAGEPPEVTIDMGPDIFDGYILNIERSADGVTDGDGRYVTPTMFIQHYVTPSERAAGTITNAALLEDGYSDPTGSGFQQYWWSREDEVDGPKTEISYSVTTSVAELYQVTGSNKSQYLTMTSAFAGYCNNNVGSGCGVRSTASFTGQKHFEVKIVSFCGGSTSDGVCIGFTNDAASLSTTHSPGSSTNPGCMFRVQENGSYTLYRNGGNTGGTLGFAPAAGDYLIAEADTATNQVVFKYHRTALGTTSTIATITLTSNIPAVWHGHVAAFQGLGDPDDSFEANFGASTFIVTPTTGYTGW